MINESIPHLRFKTRFTGQNDFYDKSLGRAFQLLFIGYEGNPPDCSLVNDPVSPLIGASEIRFTSETIREYGTNLFFEPIPLEMLYTNADRPHV